MACDSTFTYVTQGIPRRPGNTMDGGYINSTRYMNYVADLYASSGPCADMKAALLSSDAPHPDFEYPNYAFPHVCRDGAVIARPSMANISFPGTHDQSTNISVTLAVDGASRGNVSYRWDTFLEEFVFIDNLTGTWPVVLGVDCDKVEWRNFSGLVTLNQQVDLMTNYDFEAWWCCATSAYGCCGSPPAPGNPGPHFLIPRPETPGDGEQNISTPVLRTAIPLSNHTFQFRNNFGRVK